MSWEASNKLISIKNVCLKRNHKVSYQAGLLALFPTMTAEIIRVYIEFRILGIAIT